MSGYLAALGVTLAVEVPLYALALRLLGDRRPGRYAVAGLVNLSSHLTAWLGLWPVLSRWWPDAAAFVVVEALVVAWEAAWLWAWLRREPVVLGAVALATNGASLALGALL